MINRSKVGDCSRCSAKNVAGRKRAKDFLCMNCCRNDDTKKQLAKSKVRQLVHYQKVEGIVDDIQTLTIELDFVVSRYVRLAAMGKDHKVTCYTCGVRKDWKLIQCGHYKDRQHLGLRWELINLRPQCKYCNCDLDGNLEVYEANLRKENLGALEYMEETFRQVTKPTRDDLKQLLYDFQQKLRLVENSKLK